MTRTGGKAPTAAQIHRATQGIAPMGRYGPPKRPAVVVARMPRGNPPPVPHDPGIGVFPTGGRPPPPVKRGYAVKIGRMTRQPAVKRFGGGQTYGTDNDYGIKLRPPHDMDRFLNWDKYVREVMQARKSVMEGMLYRGEASLSDPQFVKDYIIAQKRSLEGSKYYAPRNWRTQGGWQGKFPPVVQVTDGLKLMGGGVGIGNGIKFANALGSINTLYSVAATVSELNELAQKAGGWNAVYDRIKAQGGIVGFTKNHLREMARMNYDARTPISQWWQIWLGRQMYGTRQEQDAAKEKSEAEYKKNVQKYLDSLHRTEMVEQMERDKKKGVKFSDKDWWEGIKEDLQKQMFAPIQRRPKGPKYPSRMPLGKLLPPGVRRMPRWINPLKKKKKKRKRK